MHRVDPVDALYDGPHFFWRDQAHLDMDSPDYQDTSSVSTSPVISPV